MTFQLQPRPRFRWSLRRFCIARTAQGWSVFDRALGERLGWYRSKQRALARSERERELLKTVKRQQLECGALVANKAGVIVADYYTATQEQRA